jgi:hypothetical protein
VGPPVIAARMRSRVVLCALAALACVTLPLAGGCGKKGPPLAPLPRLPVAPAQVSASRAGDTVTVSFTVPAANISGVRPADIERVDVYAWTGPDVPAGRVFRVAKVVASVPVRMPPPPQDPDEDGNVPPPPPPVGPGVDQGAPVQLRETLAAAAFVPVDVSDPKKKPAPAGEPKVTPPDARPLPPPLTRRYIVVGINHGGQRGRAAAAIAVPLWTAPPPPPAVAAKAVETGTELTWTAPPLHRSPVMANALPAAVRAPSRARAAAAPRRPSPDDEDPDDDTPNAEAAVPDDDDDAPAPGGARPEGSAQRRADPGRPDGKAPTGADPGAAGESATGQLPETGERQMGESGLLPARLAVPWPAISTGYHVYEIPSAGMPGAPSREAGRPAPPVPRRLTAAPLKATTFKDARVEYGVERCYIVRTAETMGTLSVESEGSAPACVRAADVFAPAAPKSLAAVSSAGAISLIWEGTEEPDLAGYIVLRGTSPGEPSERLTPQPVRETTFRDTTVKPGVRYVYAVVAVDTATPPNASEPSNRIEETAR